MPEKIIVYGHRTCPMVPPVLGLLQQTGAAYEYFNIHKDEAARQRVRQINQGNESVPTLEFPDGSTLTEPSIGALQAKLRAAGFSVPLRAVLIGYFPQIIFLLIIAFAILRFFEAI